MNKIISRGSLRLMVFLVATGCIYICNPNTSEAVIVSATSTETSMFSKEGILVTVTIDPEGKNVNAVEGRLVFDSSKLQAHSISFSDSIVGAWVNEPKILSSSIKWGGIIPGGFSGVRSAIYDSPRPGVVFQVVLASIATGTAEVSFDGLLSYANDGAATVLETKKSGLSILVREGRSRDKFSTENIKFSQSDFYEKGIKKAYLFDFISSADKIFMGSIAVLIVLILIYKMRRGKIRIWKKSSRF